MPDFAWRAIDVEGREKRGRIAAANRDSAAPLAIAWSDAIYELDYWAIVKGTPRHEQARKFIAFATSEEAQLAFSRYGADYLIEFECREIDSPEGCITEAQAKEFAESLFVAQSR